MARLFAPPSVSAQRMQGSYLAYCAEDEWELTATKPETHILAADFRVPILDRVIVVFFYKRKKSLCRTASTGKSSGKITPYENWTDWNENH